MESIASSLLSLAYQLFQPGFCPGDWAWATTMAGVLIALFPVGAAVITALMRKFTGNRYHGAALYALLGIGGVLVLLVPWMLATGVSSVFRTVFRGGTAGLSQGEYEAMQQEYCWVGPQDKYLGGGQNVYEALFYPSGDTLAYGYHLATLIGLPLLTLLAVILLARTAMRRGPKWPGRLLWVPFLVFALLAAGVEANTAVHLWVGLLPATVLGVIPVALVGPPGWSTIENADRAPDPSPRRSEPPAPALQPYREPPRTDQRRDGHRPQNPQDPQREQPSPHGPGDPSADRARDHRPPPYQPPSEEERSAQPPPPPPPGNYAPTSVAPAQEDVPGTGAAAGAAGAAAGGLAAAPGPVPAPPGSAQAGSSRFRRVRRLGHGGFGTVWEAVDTQLGRTVALKIAHAPDEDTEQRMHREARALAALSHPNCVRVYDLVEEPDGLALVMEYLQGQPLAEAVDTVGALDDVSAGRLWATMAGALSAAHEKNVLHRDVKPSNVIIDPAGVAHLIDFGIARSKGDSTLTATGMMVGTPDYVAPEAASGATASPASDAWQLAATVSFALSGHPPRGTRETPMAALMAAARAEAPSHLPRQSVHARLLTASLDPQPRNRPTLATVCREVEGWLARTGTSTDGPVTQVVPRTR